MQILDLTQTMQTHPFAQQFQTTTRSGAKLRQPSATVPAKRRQKHKSRHCHVCYARQECSHFRCRHRLQHRLDCIVIFSVHRHRVAADYGKELSQLFCKGTVSKHVARIELSINTPSL